MKTKYPILPFVILCIAILSGCANDDFESQEFGICPAVTSTDPVNQATNVFPDQLIQVNFNTEVDPATISSSSVNITAMGTAINGTLGTVGSTVTFTPDQNLDPNTTYTGKVFSSVTNTFGLAMLTDYVWSFSTGAVSTPIVIETDPDNLESDVALNKTVSSTFSEAMAPGTISDTSFTLMEGTTVISGSVNYSGLVATFDPTLNLDANTTYTATITTAATNLDGISMQSDYVWTFTTEAVLVSPILGTIENFGAFGGTAGVTNQGLFTEINNGGIGTTGASTLVTGFHDEVTADIYTETPLNVGGVEGGVFTAPPAPGTATSFAIAQQGLQDANDLYLAISPASMPGGSDPGAGELGGLTLSPGTYKSASGTFGITNGDLVLDAQGDPNATWVFQTAAELTVGTAGPAGARSVQLINGASPANVFWYVGSTATINVAGGGVMVGTIVSSAGVTFSTSGNVVLTVLNGRAISLVASVTMVNTVVNVPN